MTTSKVTAAAECSTIDKKLGFIGAGNMAQALAFGFMSAGLVKRHQIIVSAPSDRNLASWRERGLQTSNDNLDVVREAEVIFLAVKPKCIAAVVDEINETAVNRLIVSVAAGIKIKAIENRLTDCKRVIRCVTNTPVQVGAGVTVFSRGSHASNADVSVLMALFKGVGICEEVPESLMDSVVGLVGAGPAFVMLMIQSLADGGVKMGIPRHLANSFSAQTFFGAAKLVLESGKHAAVLQEEVSSPGGVTIHGLHELEKGGLRGIVVNAVEAAVNRAHELG